MILPIPAGRALVPIVVGPDHGGAEGTEVGSQGSVWLVCTNRHGEAMCESQWPRSGWSQRWVSVAGTRGMSQFRERGESVM